MIAAAVAAVQVSGMESAQTELLTLPNGPTRIEWRRSARARRVSLRIDPRGGAVVVTLPPRAGRNAGMALLMSHADWVAERLAALPGAISFADGALLPLHGEEHVVRHRPGARGTAWREGREIVVAGDPAFLARRVSDFLRTEAKRSLTDLAQRKARMAGVAPRRITVKDTKSRWGSCAANRNLAFSWRLVMAPAFVQDYVAAHEVAHLLHMNHSAKFWSVVTQLTPHTDTAMTWLRDNGPRLLRIG